MFWALVRQIITNVPWTPTLLALSSHPPMHCLQSDRTCRTLKLKVHYHNRHTLSISFRLTSCNPTHRILSSLDHNRVHNSRFMLYDRLSLLCIYNPANYRLKLSLYFGIELRNAFILPCKVNWSMISILSLFKLVMPPVRFKQNRNVKNWTEPFFFKPTDFRFSLYIFF